MHLKMSDKSQVFSTVKLGVCLLKYSSLVSLTRLVSQLNDSEWLRVSTLCKGGISCFFLAREPFQSCLGCGPARRCDAHQVWGRVSLLGSG